MNSLDSPLFEVAVVAVIASLSAFLLGRFARVPLVAIEVGLGLVLGPAILGLLESHEFIILLGDFGLNMLFFLAGMEINFKRISGRPLRRASLGWLLAVLVAFGVGLLIAPTTPAAVYIGIALTSTALGTILPVLRDAGELRTPFGTAVLAIGAIGEFGPLVAISLFLSGRNPGVSAVVLLAFCVVTGVLIFLASRGPYQRLHDLITATLHTSGQFAIRLVLLLLSALVLLSTALQLDVLLGAFAAGVLMRLLLSGAEPSDAREVESKLDAVGFGLLIPIFFISTGINFDLDALLNEPGALVLLPVFLLLLLVIRGSSGLLAVPKGSTWGDRRAIMLFAATGLPIIVATTTIGVGNGELAAGTAAALVGAGMLSVLLFPLLALTQRRGQGPQSGAFPDDEELARQG